MLDTLALRYQNYAPLALRIGLAIVFILFGIKKLADPSQTTSEIQLLLQLDLVDAAALNFYLGLIELAVASGFIVGFKVRILSIVSGVLVTSFFLSFIAKFGASINPDLYRDIGLLGGSVALFLLGPGPFSLDQYFKGRDHESKPQETHIESPDSSSGKVEKEKS